MLMNERFYWSISTGVSVRWSPSENFAYENFLTSQVVPLIACSSFSNVSRDGRQVAIKLLLSRAASRTLFNHAVVLTRLQLGRTAVFIRYPPILSIMQHS